MGGVEALILCEGETDQVLLGSYLKSQKDWRFMSQNVLKSRDPFPGKPIVWFTDTKNRLYGIWQTGGNAFEEALGVIFKREKSEHAIKSLVIVTDHDDESAGTARPEKVKQHIVSLAAATSCELTANEWGFVAFRSAYDDVSIDVLYLLVPLDEQGALETFMMRALAEQNEDQDYVIDKAKKFVEDFGSPVYLRHRREKTKATLGVALAIFSPDKIFTTMNELILSVDWTKFATAHNQFEELERI